MINSDAITPAHCVHDLGLSIDSWSVDENARVNDSVELLLFTVADPRILNDCRTDWHIECLAW